MNDPVLSSKILTDVEIIADIYQIVKSAGFSATDKLEKLNERMRVKANETCAVVINTPGITRRNGECITDGVIRSMKYNANDIMIVGGAALNIYDYKLSDYKIRRSLGTLENYIKKKTSDIDIVWWPRVFVNNVVLTSRSGAMLALKNEFMLQLNSAFTNKKEYLESKIKPYIPDLSAEDKLTITFDPRGNIAAGVFNINIIFRFGSTVLKMCDVIIHDGGSSQQYDADGKEINELRLMENDPVYCFPYLGSGSYAESFKYTNNMIYLRVKDINIAVPNIISFIDQQMLAFDNFIREKNEKAFINYKRVEFIRKLLYSPNFRDNANKKNFRDIFKTVSGSDLNFIKEFINNRIGRSVYKYYNIILSLCSDETTDQILRELCISAQKIKDAFNTEKRMAEESKLLEESEKVRKNKEDKNKIAAETSEEALELQKRRQISEMDALKEKIRAKYKKISISQFRRQYDDIYRKVDDERIMLIRMSPEKYKEYIASTPNPIDDLRSIVDQIDRDLETYKKDQNQNRKKGHRNTHNANSLLGHYQTATVHTPPSYSQPQMYPAYSTPYPPAYVNAMGRPVYPDPSTGRYVVWSPEYTRWMFVSPPLPTPQLVQRYSDDVYFRGAPQHSYTGRGRGRNTTRKNIARDNITRKRY